VQSTQPPPVASDGQPLAPETPVAPPPTIPTGPAGHPVPTPAAQPGLALGRLVLSTALLCFGVVVLVDVAGVSVPPSVYFAVPLAVIGVGLLVGAWYGRARLLIIPGIVLSLGLALSVAAEDVTANGPDGSVTWKPTSIEQVNGTYEINMGNGVLDLSAVDFADAHRSVDVHVAVGNLDIILPPNVDVQIAAIVEVGNAVVLGQRWSGIGQSRRTVTDTGADGPGGGELILEATVDVGDLEVRR
jgi:hypothetical protein